MHACTDVTGFGLAGHGWEVAERSGVRLVFEAAALPLYRGALVAAEAGVRTGGDARNRAHLEGTGHGRRPASASPSTPSPTTRRPRVGCWPSVDPGVAAELVASGAGFVEVGRVEAGVPGVELR